MPTKTVKTDDTIKIFENKKIMTNVSTFVIAKILPKALLLKTKL